MVKQVPITQKSIGINARVQETGGPQGGVRVKQQVAAQALQISKGYKQQSEENAYMRGQITLTENLDRIEKEHIGSPDSMGEAIEEYSTSFLDEIGNENMRLRFELQINQASKSSIARASAKRRGIINEEAKFSNLSALESIEGVLPSISEGLTSNDDGVALAASEQLQEVLLRSQELLGATDGDGMPLFAANFRVTQITALKDTALLGAARSWMDSQPDKVAAEKAIRDGELELQLPDGEGGFEKINVNDALSPKAQDMMQTEAKRQIAQQKVDLKNAQEKPFHIQINNEVALRAVVDDPNIPIAEKLERINRLDFENGIRDEAAADFRSYLTARQTAISAPPSEAVQIAAFDEVTADLQQLRVEFGGTPDELNSVELTPKRLKAFQKYQSKIYRKLAKGEISEAEKIRLLDPITAAVTNAIENKSTKGEGRTFMPGIQDPFGNGLKGIDTYLKNQGRETALNEKKALFSAFADNLGHFDERDNYIATGEYESTGSKSQDDRVIKKALLLARESLNAKNYTGIIDETDPQNQVVKDIKTQVDIDAEIEALEKELGLNE